jgi:cystathionine gamma-synthase
MTNERSTQAVHSGEDRQKPFGAVTTPIVQTSTYAFSDTSEILDFMRRKEAGETGIREEYGRYGNPTQRSAERKVAALEGGEQGLLFSSGMAAITTTLAALLSAGDHLVMGRECYHRSREFAESFLKRWGIETTFVDGVEAAAFGSAIRASTRFVFIETPTNPYLRVCELAAIVEACRGRDIITMVDSTFATPINLRPLEHGIDLVVHSASKYLGGHNDLLAGVVVGGRENVSRIEEARGVMGGMGSPVDSYLLLRGMKTLDLRVRRHNANGLRVARFLENHPAIRRVHYPGLGSHPDHRAASQQMSGFGGVVSFQIDGDMTKTGRFIDRLRLPYIGPTLGGVESIVVQPSALFSLDPEERRAAGLEDNLVRYALGVEDAEDIVADLEQALAQI